MLALHLQFQNIFNYCTYVNILFAYELALNVKKKKLHIATTIFMW